jgi:mercuric reductase
MKQTHYHLVILGSGSTAFAAALQAQELGKTSVMKNARQAGRASTAAVCHPKT